MSYRDDLEAARARIDALEAEVERLRIENDALLRTRARFEARANRWEQRVLGLGKRYIAAVASAARGEPADTVLLAAVERHLGLDDLAAFRHEIASFAGALAVEGKQLDPRNHDGLWTALDLVARDEGRGT
jgi:hypothetical protein